MGRVAARGVAVEPVDSLPLLLTRLAALWPAEEQAEQDDPRIPGLVDATN
ncbi:hypothetical protein [Streptosporangium minutum]|nr:hypothetical protein [Streptosporangium minutum]